MSDFFGGYPGAKAGSGGGGSGNVIGPNPSTPFGVPMFGNGGGTLLLDSVLTGRGILAGAGLNIDAVTGIDSGDLGYSFAGDAVDETTSAIIPLYSPGITGWKVSPNSNFGIDYLTDYMAGKMVSQTHIDPNTGFPNIVFVNSTILRPDTGFLDAQIGTPQAAFANISGARYTFGRTTDATRKVFMFDDHQSAGANFAGPGLGFDSSTGSEWYWISIDNAHGGLIRESFNLTYNDRATTVSAPDEATADANPAVSLVVKGANKTAGTGAGGNLHLAGGTSSGGAAGQVFVDSTNATFSGKITAVADMVTVGTLGVGNAIPTPSNNPGIIVQKIEVFDASGLSLGFIPVYDSIS